MLLSDLHRWQQALAVPIAELLGEPEGELSPPVRLRPRLLRAMKTVRSIQQRGSGRRPCVVWWRRWSPSLSR